MADHRDGILKLLNAYLPLDETDRSVCERFKVFVVEQPDCFERSLAIGHITGSAWVVDSTGTRALLALHRKLGIWLQPGGHADGVTDVLSVAQREVFEETGLHSVAPVSTAIFDLDIHKIPSFSDVPEHLHYDIRFVFRAANEPLRGNDEVKDLQWIDLDRIGEYSTERSIHRMAHKWELLKRATTGL